MTGDDLLQAVRIVAIATLFGRHWPEGSRHVAAGHLAGFLLRCGIEPAFVVRIVATAARVARDEEYEDRRRYAEDTIRKHASGAPTTGRPKIAESFPDGEGLVNRVYQWLERKGEDLLDQINETYFTARIGPTTVVAHQVPGDELETFDFAEMRNRFHNQKVGKQRLGDWWLAHPARRNYRRIVCAPPPLPCHAEDFNTWQGFTVEPDPAPEPHQRCKRFLHHLHQVICDGVDEYFSYLLDVCALTVQRPGVPSEVAIVMRGPSGVGKGTFASNFGKLFGPHFLPVSKPGQVTGRFNDHLSGCVVLFADEAVWGGNKQDVGTLRAMVTEREIAIEAKFARVVKQPNLVHLIMSTNEDWVWPVAMRERRGFILDVGEHEFMTPAYFTAIHEEWAAGGAAAFLALCQQREIYGDRLAPIPKTPGLLAQMDLSNNPLHAWWTDRLAAGEFWPGQGWPEFVSGLDLLENYLALTNPTYGRAWTKKQTEMTFTIDMKGLLPKRMTRRRRMTLVNVNANRPGLPPDLQNIQRWGWDLPRLALCRAHYDHVTGVPRDWPEPEGDASDMVTPVLTGLTGDDDGSV
jgi:hypothetical protein